MRYSGQLQRQLGTELLGDEKADKVSSVSLDLKSVRSTLTVLRVHPKAYFN